LEKECPGRGRGLSSQSGQLLFLQRIKVVELQFSVDEGGMSFGGLGGRGSKIGCSPCLANLVLGSLPTTS